MKKKRGNKRRRKRTKMKTQVWNYFRIVAKLSFTLCELVK